LNELKALETRPTYLAQEQKRSSFFDRVWMEQQLFDMEDSDHQVSSQPPHGPSHILEFYEFDEKCAGIVILGEIDKCVPMMQTPPFPTKPRVPKEVEIFQVHKNPDDSVDESWYRLGTLLQSRSRLLLHLGL
jgi:hypothetical protein